MSNPDLMKAFFECTDAYLYIKDADGRFLYMNKAGAAALGLSEAECVGKTAYDVIPKDQADEETRLDREARVEPLTITKLITLPGGERTLYDHKFPIPLPGRFRRGGRRHRLGRDRRSERASSRYRPGIVDRHFPRSPSLPL